MKCVSCGAGVTADPQAATLQCAYCGETQTNPDARPGAVDVADLGDVVAKLHSNLPSGAGRPGETVSTTATSSSTTTSSSPTESRSTTTSSSVTQQVAQGSGHLNIPDSGGQQTPDLMQQVLALHQQARNQQTPGLAPVDAEPVVPGAFGHSARTTIRRTWRVASFVILAIAGGIAALVFLEAAGC